MTVSITTNEFELTPELCAKITRDYIYNKNKILYIILVVVMLGLLLFSLWGYIELGNLDILKAWVPLLLLIVLFYFISLFIAPLLLSRSKYNRKEYQDASFEFKTHGFTHKRRDGSITIRPYNSIVNVTRGSYYLLIYENSTSMYMLPYSAFKDTSDIRKVFEFLQQAET